VKILVDENIPKMTVQVLRSEGHDVRDIRRTEFEGSNDEILWKMAQREERLFITTDMGFSVHREERHYGILIVRLKQPNRRKIHERVLKAFSQIKQWPGFLVVMHDRLQRVWRARYTK